MDNVLIADNEKDLVEEYATTYVEQGGNQPSTTTEIDQVYKFAKKTESKVLAIDQRFGAVKGIDVLEKIIRNKKSEGPTKFVLFTRGVLDKKTKQRCKMHGIVHMDKKDGQKNLVRNIRIIYNRLLSDMENLSVNLEPDSNIESVKNDIYMSFKQELIVSLLLMDDQDEGLIYDDQFYSISDLVNEISNDSSLGVELIKDHMKTWRNTRGL